MEFRNCAPGDALGYPACYRATYHVAWWSTTAHLRQVVENDVVTPMSSSSLAAPLNGVGEILDGATVAVVDFQVWPTGSDATVTDLVHAIAAVPLHGWYPEIITPVILESIERITLAAVGSGGRADVAATLEERSSGIAHAATMLALVVVIVAVAWGLSSIAKLKRG